jgi:hypothetical protein
MSYDYARIEALHAAARRERAEYLHCLFQRAILWLRARLLHADAGPRTVPCC